ERLHNIFGDMSESDIAAVLRENEPKFIRDDGTFDMERAIDLSATILLTTDPGGMEEHVDHNQADEEHVVAAALRCIFEVFPGESRHIASVLVYLYLHTLTTPQTLVLILRYKWWKSMATKLLLRFAKCSKKDIRKRRNRLNHRVHRLPSAMTSVVTAGR